MNHPMNQPDTEAVATIRRVVTPELTARALADSADEQLPLMFATPFMSRSWSAPARNCWRRC
jgi:hypothetical protein